MTKSTKKAGGTKAALRLGTQDRRLDIDATNQGVEKECPFRPGLFVRILPGLTFNARYHKAVIALSERLAMEAAEQRNGKAEKPRKSEKGPADPVVGPVTSVEERFFDPEFVVDALVADMRGLYDAAGEEVRYSREVGLQVLSDPAHADVLHWVGNEAHDYGRYYTDQLVDDAGNSPNGSSGNAAGADDSEKTRR